MRAQASSFITKRNTACCVPNGALTPTANGLKAFNDLSEEAGRYDTWLTADFTPEERAVLSKCLRQLAAR